MSRYAGEECGDCGEPLDDHDRERVRQDDGQYVFRWVCPDE